VLDPRVGRQSLIAHLGEAKRLKREDPERIVGVGGCWAQSLKDEVFERFPFVDVAFGPGQVHRLAEFLLSDSHRRSGLLRVRVLHRRSAGKARARIPGLAADQRRLQLRCSYCIVPSTRGREVSRALDVLVEQARRWRQTACAS
jgi:tRNA-2-methylthio-N6-dimethylallyladenosine synthase